MRAVDENQEAYARPKEFELPLRRLYGAVLARAYADLKNRRDAPTGLYCRSHKRSLISLGNEAEDWIMGRSVPTGGISVETCYQVLEMNPEALLACLRKQGLILSD